MTPVCNACGNPILHEETAVRKGDRFYHGGQEACRNAMYRMEFLRSFKPENQPPEDAKKNSNGKPKGAQKLRKLSLTDILKELCWDPYDPAHMAAWAEANPEQGTSYPGKRLYRLEGHCTIFEIVAIRHGNNGGYQIVDYTLKHT